MGLLNSRSIASRAAIAASIVLNVPPLRCFPPWKICTRNMAWWRVTCFTFVRLREATLREAEMVMIESAAPERTWMPRARPAR